MGKGQITTTRKELTPVEGQCVAEIPSIEAWFILDCSRAEHFPHFNK